MNPGEATNFFRIPDLPEFDKGTTTKYNRTNALWLIEFSRLIYRQENDEKPRPPNFPSRESFLAPKGLQEFAFLNTDKTQVALFRNDKLKCAALVFRGTLGLTDAITDANFIPVRWEGGGFVHNGFKSAFDDVWKNLLKPELLELGFPFFLTGHSLGAALATLTAVRCLQDPDFEKCRPQALYTFGSPRTGDKAFGAGMNGLFHCRVVNNKDIVTAVPPAVPIPGGITFQHVGQLHRLEAGNQLHIFPPDTDELDAGSLAIGPLKFVESLSGLLDGVRAFGLDPPEPLRDHTPVNYTARLERAR